MMCLAHVPAEDVVALPAGTSWRVPWELLVLGPFLSCVLADGDQMRHVTVAAMVRSAVRRSTLPEEPLHAEDYETLRVFAPETSLVEAARLVVETGWEMAVVSDPDARLITSRTVLRTLLQSEPQQPATGRVECRGRDQGHQILASSWRTAARGFR